MVGIILNYKLDTNQLLQLRNLLVPKMTKYIPHTPSIKQQAFLVLNCLEAFYGGAAGGGKSDALLMAALQYVDIPGYSALLLRDTYKNLTMSGALLDRADSWLSGTDARWDGESKTYRFPSGATITFGYLDGPKDHLNYKSSEFQFIGPDEAGDLRWNQIMYLFSRLRRKTPDAYLKELYSLPKFSGISENQLQYYYEQYKSIPLRFRMASNPGGISHSEIKTKYIDPETRDSEAVFIPAGLTDNPALNYEEYTKSLMHLDPVTRAQLLNGDWDIREKGRMFDRSWFKIVPEIPGRVLSSVRYWDLAATEPRKSGHEPAYTAGVKISQLEDYRYIIESIIRFRKTPRVVEAVIAQTAELDGISVPIYMEQEPGSSGVNTIDHYRRTVLPQYAFQADKVTGNKIQRAAPLSSQAEAGNILLLSGSWNKDFLEEAELFPDGKFKDQIDATSGGFQKIAGSPTGIRVRVI
jgi:predicted phage terminase large subunit-like protein